MFSVVDKICHSDCDYELGKIGPYILSCQSIRKLQTTLPDEVRYYLDIDFSV